MKITLIQIGKTQDACLSELIEKYYNRTKKYLSYDLIEIPEIKNKGKNNTLNFYKNKEGQEIFKKINSSDYIILLDEKGKSYTSQDFAGFLQKKMNSGIKNLVFIIGGAYGFSEEIYKRANDKISLSKMTFSHQLIRVIFAEQLYRALTIINNHPYHND